MNELSELKLEWKRRAGGVGRTQRDFLDFVIDNRSLSEVVGGDLASCLGWFGPEENMKAARRLLLEEPADLPNDRRAIYVCAECRDIGCGAVTLIIEQSGEDIIWRDFGYENNYEDDVYTEGYQKVGPFTFNRTEYSRAIKKALDSKTIEQRST